MATYGGQFTLTEIIAPVNSSILPRTDDCHVACLLTARHKNQFCAGLSSSPGIQRYFLNDAMVTVMATPSSMAAGHISRFGYTAVGHDRYKMQGMYIAGLMDFLAW